MRGGAGNTCDLACDLLSDFYSLVHSIVPRKVHKSLQTVFVFSARVNGVWPARLLSSSLSNHSLLFRNVPSLFLLLFESIAEQTSELEDVINVDGQLLVFHLLLKYRNNAILGAEAT